MRILRMSRSQTKHRPCGNKKLKINVAHICIVIYALKY